MTIATVLLPLVLLLAQAPAAVPAPPPDEEVQLRAAIQQYYEAQAARDPDRAAAFWSATASPRMSRDAFVVMFGEPAEDSYIVEIRAVEMRAADARVRVFASRTRLVTHEGSVRTQRSTFLNSQLWRKEPAGWRLLRDGPFADEVADDILAAAPSDRPALYEKYRSDLVPVRLAISQRATMAITIPQDYARGRALFEVALEVSRAANDRRGEANSLHNIAQSYYFQRNYAPAAEAYEKELAVGREIDDREVAAGALFGLGTVSYSKAEYTAALGHYREALEIYEKWEDGAGIGRTAVSIGNVQYLQAEYDAASASYRRGLALALASYDRAGASFARRGLARVLAAQGDVPAALDMYGQVLTDAREDLRQDARMTSAVATTLESIGELYYRIGNTDQARTNFEEARQLFQRDPDGSGRVLAALGKTELMAGRFDAALASYSESRARFELARNGEGAAHAWVGVGFSQAARKMFAEAAAAYRTAIALFEKLQNNDGVARGWLGLSLAQSGGGDETAALESAGKVTAIAARLKSDDLAWRGAVRSGEALHRLSRLDEARQAFERAAIAIDRLAAAAPVNTEARGELGDSASAWTGLALTLARQGNAAGALAALEARRAHIRRVDFAPFHADIARGATDEERTEEQAIVREIVSVRAQLRAEAQAGRRDQARADRLVQQLTALAERRAAQQARLYARLPQLSVMRGLPQPPMSEAAIADLVPGPRGLLVTYLLADAELLVVTVAGAGAGAGAGAEAGTRFFVAATTVPIDRRAFADALAAAMQPDVLKDPAEWRKRAAPLAATLLEPIATRFADRDRVVIVPDDLIWKVPFEALPLGDADLGARARVTYATSFATLALQRQAALAAVPMPPAPGVLAAPEIPGAIRTQLLLMSASWKPQDPDAARAAAQAVATAYGESVGVRSGTDASEAAMRTLLGTSDVLHVQAPVQISGPAPLLSSVILAGSGGGAAEDGRFEARDWFAIDARTRLAVMPDGSGFGAAGVGGAMDPIAWATASAGVSALVIGRWPADGFAADALAAAFHAKVAAGAPPGEAWRSAVDATRAEGAAPAAWAGLRLIGTLSGGGS